MLGLVCCVSDWFVLLVVACFGVLTVLLFALGFLCVIACVWLVWGMFVRFVCFVVAVVVYDVGLVRRCICGVFVWNISCSAFVGFCGGIVMLPWCWLFGLDWIYCLCFGHCFKSLCCADCVCLVCYGYFVLVGLRELACLKTASWVVCFG